MFYLRYASVALKSNVTSASHNFWFYYNLIHASHCQNFLNVYKTYGVTFQIKSCLIILHSIFKIQVFSSPEPKAHKVSL